MYRWLAAVLVLVIGVLFTSVAGANTVSNRGDYLNPNTGRFWTMDTFQGNHQDSLSLHKYLYAAGNPVNALDPSGNIVSLNDISATIGAMMSTVSFYAGPVITYGRIALAGLTLAAFVAEPEFRAAYVSTAGGPSDAGRMLAAEIGIGWNAGVNLFRHGTVAPNVVNIQFNTGDANDFRVKTADLKRAADGGNLVVVENPSSIRDASAQEAYRKAVRNRYVNFLQEMGMNKEQALARADQKFKTLQADHRIDLQVSGGLADPNADTNLRMLDGSVNMSVGRQLANEIERLGLQSGDLIHEVNVIGPVGK